MTDRNDRIRESAYSLWLEEGRPEDVAERHWLAAEGLIEDGPDEGEFIDGGLGEAQKARPARQPRRQARTDLKANFCSDCSGSWRLSLAA